MDDPWKHGDMPQQVFEVISRGIPNTAMMAWSSSYSKEEIRSVVEYLYYLRKAGTKAPK